MAALRRAASLARQLRSLPALASCSAPAAPELPWCCQAARAISTGRAACAPTHILDEPYCRQRQLVVLGNRVPELAPDTWIAPNAVVVGDVDLYDRVSIWYGCVLRGDLNAIRVGSYSNIQDRSILHASRTSPTGLSAATQVGYYVTVGQRCLLRSTNVQDEVILGDGCILLEGSMVEEQSILAPGTVLPPGHLVPGGQLWAGNPARFVRDLTPDEKAEIKNVATGMFRLIDAHSSEFILPRSFAYVEAEKIRALLAEAANPPAKPEEAPTAPAPNPS